MVKIWEIDFTVFSGVGNNEPQDNVGTQHLTSVVGTPVKIPTIGGLTNRPGIRFQINNSDQRYEISTAGINAGKFKNSYAPTSKRSFVTWIYVPSTSRDGSDAMIWGDDNSNAYRSGFVINTSNEIDYYVSSSVRYSSPTVTAGSWHMLAMTVDRTLPKTTIYYQGLEVASGTYVPSTTEGFGYRSSIGDTFQTQEPGVDVALIQVYDHILSSGSVAGLYESFILDSAGGEDPIFTLSGTVYDPADTPVSGAPVALYHVEDNEVYERVNSDGNGDYTLHIPFAGDYIIFTSSTPPNKGARAVSVSASGVAGSGTVTFYD